ncbi:MAG: hypothetical protein WBH57_11975 [Anaerolineae bacterium]
MSYPRHPTADPETTAAAARAGIFDRPFWAVFPAIAILGITICLAMFEYNYHPLIYRYTEDVTILEVGDSELDFNHPPGAFSVWWQSGSKEHEGLAEVA